MSVYLVKGKGWRYDFTLNGQRYTQTWFRTKRQAMQEEQKRREELTTEQAESLTPTDTAFLNLVNDRLDHLKAYNSVRHYQEHVYLARRWVKEWDGLECSEISREMIEKFIIRRSLVSAFTANKELRYLRAAFNYGLKRKLIKVNPTEGVGFMPVEKRIKYVPPAEDINKVIEAADPDTQDYLWTIRDTMGRISEINRLTWDDVSLEGKYVVLYTRKKKGGHLTPRKVPMTNRLLDVMFRRFNERDNDKPWVFWHTYTSSKTGEVVTGPYGDRKKVMKTLCEKAGVKYFRFHALRHAGASILDNGGAPIGSIQRLLGHENRTTTEIYLHSIGETERAAISILEQGR